MSTMVGKRMGVGEVLDNHSGRLYKLEQQITSPESMPSGGTDTYDELHIGPEGNRVTLSRAVSAPLNLQVVTAAYENDSYADVDWDPPADGQFYSYEVVLGKLQSDGTTWVTDRVERVFDDSLRFTNLNPGETYGVRVYSVNRLGDRSAPLPATGWLDFPAASDSTNPSQVTGVQLYSGITSLVVVWNEVEDPDVKNGRGLYEVIVRENQAPNPPVTIHQKRVGGTITSFTGLNAETTYYVQVRAIDASSNEGPWSDTATTDAAGVATDHIVAAGLSADVITFGVMDGDRIDVNSLNANRLTSSEMSGTTITLGTDQFGAPGRFQIGDATNGLFLDATGLRLFSGGNERASLLANGIAQFNADDIVAGTISGDHLDVRSIKTSHLTMGAENLWEDPSWLHRNHDDYFFHEAIGTFDTYVSSTSAAIRTGGRCLRFTLAGGTDQSYLLGPGQVFGGFPEQWLPCSEGEKFYFSYWVGRDTAAAGVQTRAMAAWRDANGDFVTTTYGNIETTQHFNSRVKVEATFEAPAGAAVAGFGVRIYPNSVASGQVYFDDFMLRRRSTTLVIDDLAIDTDRLAYPNVAQAHYLQRFGFTTNTTNTTIHSYSVPIASWCGKATVFATSHIDAQNDVGDSTSAGMTMTVTTAGQTTPNVSTSVFTWFETQVLSAAQARTVTAPGSSVAVSSQGYHSSRRMYCDSMISIIWIQERS